MIISPSLKQQIAAYAREQYPKEMCGFIVNGDFIQVPNVHETPEKDFRVAKEVFMEYAGKAEAFIHSHPDWYAVPSQKDMEQQIATAMPWGIISLDKERIGSINLWGDMLPVPDLKMRGFVHGVTDCFDLIRHEKFLRTGEWIKQIPRSWEWWLKGQDLYKDHFYEVGYREVDQEEIDDVGPTIGDIGLAIIGPKNRRINHGGIYMGKSQILHHVTSVKPEDATRLAKLDPVERYMNYIVKWVRYDPGHSSSR